jgi:DNA-binding MarR family transcriptional regulator
VSDTPSRRPSAREAFQGDTPTAGGSRSVRPEPDPRDLQDGRTSKDRSPTLPELQISARILLHIARQPRVGREEVPPPSLTQAGIAEALGSTQASVSNALNRLVDGGAVEVERSYVQHRWIRLKTYRLTALGERLARQIRQRFGL